MLPSRGPDAGRAGVSAGREAGGEAGNAADPELNAAAPSFVPSALRGSRGEAPAHRDAATSPERAAERAAEDRSGVSAPADQGSGVEGSPQDPPSLLQPPKNPQNVVSEGGKCCPDFDSAWSGSNGTTAAAPIGEREPRHQEPRRQQQLQEPQQ